MRIANSTSLKIKLFLTFSKIGLFTFGGAYAMIPLIESECVEKNNWITHDEMMNITVIAESTPGPISVNCATYVGYMQAGLIGAIMATLGLVLPSFVVIYLISLKFDGFLSLTLVANAFKGIKTAVGLLILNAAITMIKKMPQKQLPRIIMLLSFLSMMLINVFSLRLSSIYLMLTAGLISLAIFFAKTNLYGHREAGK